MKEKYHYVFVLLGIWFQPGVLDNKALGKTPLGKETYELRFKEAIVALMFFPCLAIKHKRTLRRLFVKLGSKILMINFSLFYLEFIE